MRRVPASVATRRALVASSLVAFALGTVGACGGGGGGGGGGAGPTGDVEGSILLPDQTWSTIAEREPNDTVAQAQVVPPIQPRSSISIAGEAGVGGTRLGRVDTTDAFRIRSHAAQTATLTLTASTGGLFSGSFDLAAFRTSDGVLLGVTATLANPEVLVLALPADTAVDVVVTCAFGDGPYVLRIQTADPIGPATVSPGSVAALARAASLPEDDPGLLPSYDAVVYAAVDPECAPGRLLVRARDGVGGERLAARIGGRVLRRTGAGTYVVEIPRALVGAEAREALAAASRLLGDGDVVFAEPDWTVHPLGEPDDADFQRQWNLAAIGCPSAWDITRGSPSTVVGVIDTGIAAHPELDAQRVPGFDFVSDPGQGGDGDGRDPDPTDEGAGRRGDGTPELHGTHVAGILAARSGDGRGISGVAPGCKIMPLRVIGVTGGTVSDLADAIRYAAGLSVAGPAAPLPAPLPVVNLSLGTSQNATELQDACAAAEAAGVLLCCAAGNAGESSLLYPARYPTTLAVGATDARFLQTTYSNSGDELDCVAPGGDDRHDAGADGFLDDILSTFRDETTSPPTPGLVYYGGTSMATPHVSGVAALVRSVNPAISRAQLRATVLDTCRDLGAPGRDDATGQGIVQAGEAVRRALADLGTPRSDPPYLVLSTTTLRIPANQTSATVYVTNGGGGTLTLTNVVASTDGGVQWLSGGKVSSTVPGDPSSVSLIFAQVDRTGLANGFYAGTLLVRDGATALGAVRVILEVGAAPLNGVSIQVSALDSGSRRVVRTGFALPQTGYRYTFRGLPTGTYRIRAGTDLDHDGFACEVGDLCGEHDGVDSPAIVVREGEVTEGIDVAIR